MSAIALVLLALVGVALLAAGVALRLRVRRQRAAGRWVAADLPRGPAPTLRSERYRLSGRPDELRVLPDGRWVAVELKSRAAPRRPYRSHRLQVSAYSLLLEESTGRAPPFGLLRYGDGTEFRVPWDPAARAELLAVRRELDRPYDGGARPSPGRCAGCAWRRACDRSLAPAGG